MIDGHVHIFPPEIIDDRESYLARDARFAMLYQSPQAKMATAEEVVAHMDETGVSTAVVFGYAFADQGLCRLVNDYVIEAVRRYAGRLVGLACVWTAGPGAAQEAERCLEAGLRGCGELILESEVRGGALREPRGRRTRHGLWALAQLLRERGAPLLVHANELVGHAYPGKGPFGPEACVDLAQKFPGLKIVFAHLGGGAFVYEAMPEVAATLADAYYDTSAVPYLYRQGIYEAVLATAGSHKLIFGSDYPLLSPARYRSALDLLSEDVRQAVYEENARKVFGI
jgi:predicted TIM-barrel fold metal-dependent hydrolase